MSDPTIRLARVRKQLEEAVGARARYRCYGAAEILLIDLGFIKSEQPLPCVEVEEAGWWPSSRKRKRVETYPVMIERLIDEALEGFDASR